MHLALSALGFLLASATGLPGTAPSTRPATTQAVEPEIIELRLSGPRSSATRLKWPETTENVRMGHLFERVRVAVIDPTGKRVELDAYNVFAVSMGDSIINISVRPAWPHDTQAN